MIQIAITSHKSSYEKCAIPLVKSFLSSGIELNKIFVFVGGYDNRSSNIDLCRIYKTNHNSYDHTAIIEIIENNIYNLRKYDFAKMRKIFDFQKQRKQPPQTIKTDRSSS